MGTPTQPNEEWISLREFGRRREVSLPAVQKAIASGRVTAIKRSAKGRIEGIEYHAATRQWNDNTDPDQAARAGQGPAPELNLVAGSEQQASTEAPPEEKGKHRDPHGYLAARADSARAEAELKQLEVLKQKGEVIYKADQRQVNHRRYRALRDKIQSIPDRTCDVLAAERDPGAVHAILRKEIEQVLNELADDAVAEATPAAAERVAA